MSVDASKKLPIMNRLRRLRRWRGFTFSLVFSSIQLSLCNHFRSTGYSEGVLGARFYARQGFKLGLWTKRLGAALHASL